MVAPTSSTWPCGICFVVMCGVSHSGMLSLLVVLRDGKSMKSPRWDARASWGQWPDWVSKSPVCTENLNPGVVVMKSAQDGA